MKKEFTEYFTGTYTYQYPKDKIKDVEDSINELNSRELIVQAVMRRYNISESDLKDVDLVKTKLRDILIDDILK
jgi:hypothetical protein